MISTFFPPGADTVTVFPSHAIGNRETEIGGNLCRLFFRVDGPGND